MLTIKHWINYRILSLFLLFTVCIFLSSCATPPTYDTRYEARVEAPARETQVKPELPPITTYPPISVEPPKVEKRVKRPRVEKRTVEPIIRNEQEADAYVKREMESLLLRMNDFPDKPLDSYNDKYWSNLSQNTGLTSIEVKERAAKLLFGLAQSMGGNMLEPQFWYEHGLMAEYVDYMPQIFALKKQELKAFASRKLAESKSKKKSKPKKRSQQ